MRKSKQASALITFSMALLVYLFTMPPDLTWAHFGGDGGELITASLTLGIPHPSGYPTYVVLGKLFSLLPLGTAVFKFHLFSAIATALAATFLTQTVFTFPQLLTRPWAAISAGLLFAFTPLVWSQAIIAEVYSLNVLLVSLFLWALLTKRPYWLIGLFLGLAVTTHLTSLFLLPAALLHLRHTVHKRHTAFITLLLFFLLGLLPFLLLPLLASGNSPIVWGNPSTWRGWWWLVSGKIYFSNQFAFTHIDYAQKFSLWGNHVVWLGLSVLGVLFAFKQVASRQIRGQMGVLAATAVFYLFYAFTTNTSDAIVLILPAIFILCLLLVPTLAKVEWLALALPLLLLLLNFSSVNLRGDRGIRPYAEQLLHDAPANAVLITEGDPALFALWYFHFSEGQRPDIAIVDNHLFAFDWYRARLQQTYPDLVVPQVDDLQKLQTEQEAERPFCYVNITAESVPKIINSCAEDS